MNEPLPKPEPNPKAQGSIPGKKPAADADAAASKDPEAPKKLTPEEQMARFEDDLKENDWGHQPC